MKVMNDISTVSAIEGTNSLLTFEARKCHKGLFWVSIFASGHRGRIGMAIRKKKPCPPVPHAMRSIPELKPVLVELLSPQLTQAAPN